MDTEAYGRELIGLLHDGAATAGRTAADVLLNGGQPDSQKHAVVQETLRLTPGDGTTTHVLLVVAATMVVMPEDADDHDAR